jgi:hypothetical protein
MQADRDLLAALQAASDEFLTCVLDDFNLPAALDVYYLVIFITPYRLSHSVVIRSFLVLWVVSTSILKPTDHPQHLRKVHTPSRLLSTLTNSVFDNAVHRFVLEQLQGLGLQLPTDPSDRDSNSQALVQAAVHFRSEVLTFLGVHRMSGLIQVCVSRSEP